MLWSDSYNLFTDNKVNIVQSNEINIHGFLFIEIETGYVLKPNWTLINRVPLSAIYII